MLSFPRRRAWLHPSGRNRTTRPATFQLFNLSTACGRGQMPALPVGAAPDSVALRLCVRTIERGLMLPMWKCCQLPIPVATMHWERVGAWLLAFQSMAEESRRKSYTPMCNTPVSSNQRFPTSFLITTLRKLSPVRENGFSSASFFSSVGIA